MRKKFICVLHASASASGGEGPVRASRSRDPARVLPITPGREPDNQEARSPAFRHFPNFPFTSAHQPLPTHHVMQSLLKQSWEVMAVMVALAAAAMAANEHCDRLLRLAQNENGTTSSGSLEVIVRGVRKELVVRWEEGSEAARAHAAIAAALARRLGYGSLRFSRSERMGSEECSVRAWRAGEPIAPLLHVRVARGPACPAAAAAAATAWPFYALEHNLRNCTFLRMSDLGSNWAQYERIVAEGAEECGDCAVVVAGRGARAQAGALQRAARALGLLLRVVVGDALRLPAGADGRSLLLLAEPLWAAEPDVHVVYAPPCDDASDVACRFKLDYLQIPTAAECSRHLYLYAPLLYHLVSGFVPTATDIRDVLKLESVNGNNTEEAACEWLLANLNRIRNSSLDGHIQYGIRLFLCRDDVDHAEYQHILTEILNVTRLNASSVHIKTESIECLHEDALHSKYTEYLNKLNEQTVIGWVAMGVGLSKIDEAAQQISLPIVSYEAPPSALRPNGLVRPVTGSARVLARALVHLWAQCGASRIAVISDSTAYSRNFMSFLSDQDLNIRQANVTSAKSITVALQQLRAADARVYFVNADEATATRVMCAAAKADMTDERRYLWVARQWRGRGGCGEPAVLTVALAWRGAAGAEGWAPPGEGKGARALRRAFDARYEGRAWPPLAAPLADALLLLTHSLLAFLGRHPNSKYDRRAFGNTQNFMEAVRGTHVGVTQELRYNESDFELESGLAFVERWRGERRQVAAAWRLRRDGLEELLRRPALCGAPVRDRARCLTTLSGDPFTPSCHDFMWLSLAVVMLAAPFMLYYARRARLHGLKLRDLALLQQLTEQRKISSRKFASQLVSRNEFELREELGSGAHGRVRVAVLRRPRHPPLAVAAKEATEKRLQDEADLIREACVLSTLKHENIVRLLGVCLDGPALFFMEYAFFGDLRNYLRVRRALAEFACAGSPRGCLPEGHDVAEAIHVSASALTRLARHAASALDYLSKQRIVHRDVRAANCLIDETRTLKLADFGLARTLSDEDEEYTNQHLRRLPIACMAPESLTNGVFSTASDVWGLGVLMLELVTLGAPPYGNSGAAEIMNGVRAGEHPPLPPAANALTRGLLVQCWRLCASERPTAAHLAAFLQLNRDTLAPAFPRPYTDVL